MPVPTLVPLPFPDPSPPHPTTLEPPSGPFMAPVVYTNMISNHGGCTWRWYRWWCMSSPLIAEWLRAGMLLVSALQYVCSACVRSCGVVSSSMVWGSSRSLGGASGRKGRQGAHQPHHLSAVHPNSGPTPTAATKQPATHRVGHLNQLLSGESMSGRQPVSMDGQGWG